MLLAELKTSADWRHSLSPLSLPEVRNWLRFFWQDQTSPSALKSLPWAFFENENPACGWKTFLLVLIEALGLPVALDGESARQPEL